MCRIDRSSIEGDIARAARRLERAGAPTIVRCCHDYMGIMRLPENSSTSATAKGPVLEVFKVFLALGCTSFGAPLLILVTSAKRSSHAYALTSKRGATFLHDLSRQAVC